MALAGLSALPPTMETNVGRLDSHPVSQRPSKHSKLSHLDVPAKRLNSQRVTQRCKDNSELIHSSNVMSWANALTSSSLSCVLGYDPYCMASPGPCLVLSLDLQIARQFRELPNMHSFSVYVHEHCSLLLATKSSIHTTREKKSVYMLCWPPC